jgi:hypothetical protein
MTVVVIVGIRASDKTFSISRARKVTCQCTDGSEYVYTFQAVCSGRESFLPEDVLDLAYRKHLANARVSSTSERELERAEEETDDEIGRG